MTLDPDERGAMETAARLAIAFRDAIGEGPATTALRPDQILPRFREPLSEHGAPASDVIEALVAAAADGIHAHTSPRFFGYVFGGSMPVGVAADMLVSAWGQNSASSWETPSIAAMEQMVCEWCLDLLRLPSDCGVGIVTGATLANTQAIMVARHALLARQGWDVEDKGMFGAPEIPVLIGAGAHSAPLAGLRYAGFGAGRVRSVTADAEGRIDAEDMRTALEACGAPPLVILQAGHVNTGAFDPFEQIIPMVRDRGGWVHVDGAFGLWVHAVPDLRARLAGVDQADSWAVDLHKWLSVPYDSALCIVRDRPALVASMCARGAYLPSESSVWEPADSTMELSRRGRGVPAYAILKHLGKAGVRALIAGHCVLAQRVAARLSGEPGIEVLNNVASNQVAVTCRNDSLTQAVLARVQERGRVYPSHGSHGTRSIIRISISNYATTEADVDLLTDEIIAAKRALELD